MARKHTINVAADGAVSVTHHDNAVEALTAIADVGVGAALGGGEPPAANNFPHTAPLREPEVTEFDKAVHREVGKRCNVLSIATRTEQAKLETATRVAQAMIHHGNTRRRDPDYIADKARDIANALHDRYPTAHTLVSWDDIESAVRAEMGQQSA